MAGFEFYETMSGSYRLDASPHRERAISFTVGGRVDSMGKFLRDRVANIQGAIEVEGLAAHRPARGTMLMDPILGRTVGYELAFTDDEGKRYRLSGRKSVRHIEPTARRSVVELDFTLSSRISWTAGSFVSPRNWRNI